MRATYLVLLVGLGACFNPKYASPGYFCHATDNPACPDGQSCVDGRCVNSGDVTVVVDASQSMPGDAGTGKVDMSGPGGLLDFSMNVDLSKPDLLTCLPTGGDCTYHDDSLCCSNYCIYSTNKCK